jgi:hypothetical protein
MVTTVGKISISTSFYEQSEFFDVCEINGSKFALFSKHIESTMSISLDMSDYNVVLLAPLQAEKNISVKAVSVIVLTTLNAKNGKSEISASGKSILLGGGVISDLENTISGDKGVTTCGCIKERWEMILGEFKEGISNKHGPTIVDALVHTYDAIVDPLEENEDIDISKAFAFFNISSNT